MLQNYSRAVFEYGLHLPQAEIPTKIQNHSKRTGLADFEDAYFDSYKKNISRIKGKDASEIAVLTASQLLKQERFCDVEDAYRNNHIITVHFPPVIQFALSMYFDGNIQN